jgi:hypothetical protein
MMITNSAPKFFRTTIRKNLSLITTKNKLCLLLGLLLFVSCNKGENLNVQSLKTTTGWGYFITNNKKIIIKQTIIPVISENKSFKTEQEALKVGNLVVQKLKDDLPPTVTKKDLFLLAVKI